MQPDSVCAVGQRTHGTYRECVQSEPHLSSDVVLGQLATERIGLEDGIVLSVSGAARSRLVLGATTTFSPTEVGALSVVAHPVSDSVSHSFSWDVHCCTGEQPVAVYHLTHSITSAVGSLLPEVSH